MRPVGYIAHVVVHRPPDMTQREVVRNDLGEQQSEIMTLVGPDPRGVRDLVAATPDPHEASIDVDVVDAAAGHGPKVLMTDIDDEDPRDRASGRGAGSENIGETAGRSVDGSDEIPQDGRHDHPVPTLPTYQSATPARHPPRADKRPVRSRRKVSTRRAS